MRTIEIIQVYDAGLRLTHNRCSDCGRLKGLYPVAVEAKLAATAHRELHIQEDAFIASAAIIEEAGR